ncbi:MAG TPA: hypothetical protein VEY12_10300, partial [Thermoplasmata archaeon]|nr:hypothetical protein [Thermoplasmata archaeon]
ERGVYSVSSENVPEAAVAYEETYLIEVLSEHGLTVLRTDYGNWSGRIVPPNYHPNVLYQDTYILARTQERA